MSNFLPQLSTPFPKIAVILGADTSVGQLLLRDLLHSDQIDKVHALTSTRNIPILQSIPSNIKRKAREHVVDFDNLSPTFKRISECDIAFCVSYTDRHAYKYIGDDAFRALNYEGPVKFIKQIFLLGALHLSVLSHINAEASSRSEFYKIKGDVEDFTLRLRLEAAQYAPFISMYRLPTPVTDPRAARSSRDPTSTPLANGEVVRAMIIDSFAKAVKKQPPSGEPLSSNEKRIAEQFFYSDDVLNLLRDDQVSLGSHL